jgi:hypothetical protein
VLPEYDKDRVYLSDIRKVVMWYNLLHQLGITDFEAPEEEKKDAETGKDAAAETDNAKNDTKE